MRTFTYSTSKSPAAEAIDRSALLQYLALSPVTRKDIELWTLTCKAGGRFQLNERVEIVCFSDGQRTITEEEVWDKAPGKKKTVSAVDRYARMNQSMKRCVDALEKLTDEMKHLSREWARFQEWSKDAEMSKMQESDQSSKQA